MMIAMPVSPCFDCSAPEPPPAGLSLGCQADSDSYSDPEPSGWLAAEWHAEPESLSVTEMVPLP